MKALRKTKSELVSQKAQKEHFDALQVIKKELGARNFKALETTLYSTKKVQVEALKAVKNGKPCTQKRFAELVVSYKSELTYRNKVRALKNKFRLSGKGPDSLHRIISRLDNGLERAKRRKENRVASYLKYNVVPKISGKTFLKVVLVNEPEEVGYHSYVEKGEWYSKSCEYKKNDLYVTAHMPANWWSRVFERDLAVVDGVFNLDVSTPLVGNFPKGVEIFAATCLISSRGTSKRVERLFLARHVDGIAYHGKTIQSALKGLNKKIELQVIPDRPSSSYLIERAKLTPGDVCLEDSYAVGNCVWGTKDFCNRHNIDISGTYSAIPLKTFAEKVELEPRREALAVLYRMIKKHQGMAEVS